MDRETEDRFNRLEMRMMRLEEALTSGIAILKWVGSTAVVLLAASFASGWIR